MSITMDPVSVEAVEFEKNRVKILGGFGNPVRDRQDVAVWCMFSGAMKTKQIFPLNSTGRSVCAKKMGSYQKMEKWRWIPIRFLWHLFQDFYHNFSLFGIRFRGQLGHDSKAF